MIPINEIVTGDCLEVMASWEAESVGLILTSPPYNVGLKYDGFDDHLPEDDFREFNRRWVAEAYRIAQESSRFYAVVGDKMIWWFKPLAEAAGWTYVQVLTWCKPNFVSTGKSISQDWNYMSETILLFRKGKRTPMLSDHDAGTTHNWFNVATPQSNFTDGRIHPAQMPFRLCRRILARTPGEPVLDPFAGSGQVCRAAKALGRSWVGIELVPTVAERARQFISGELRRQPGQLSLGDEYYVT